MKMNLPNKLTIFRICLVPVFVIVGYLPIDGQWLGVDIRYWIMDLIFIIASLTDMLDGRIARKNNLVTTFGKFLDPIADKILVVSALIMLVHFGKCPAWIPIVVLFREFLVSGYRLVAAEKNGTVIAASIWGKIKTVSQMLAIILCFANNYGFAACFLATTNEAEALTNSSLIFISNGAEIVVNALAMVMLLVSVAATVFSGIDYLKGGKELFKDET